MAWIIADTCAVNSDCVKVIETADGGVALNVIGWSDPVKVTTDKTLAEFVQAIGAPTEVSSDA